MATYRHEKSADALFTEATQDFDQKNYLDAYGKFLLCAAEGSPASEYNLAVMFAFGHGVDRDLITAEQWAQKSWDHGLEEAKGLFAFILRKRAEAAEQEGDAAQYIEFLSRSAELGNNAARVKIAELKGDYDTLAELHDEAKKSPIYQFLKELEK